MESNWADEFDCVVVVVAGIVPPPKRVPVG